MKAKETFTIRGIRVDKNDIYEFQAIRDGYDEYFDTLAEAVKQIRKWFREGYRNLSICIDIYSPNTTTDGVWYTLLNYGNFPH